MTDQQPTVCRDETRSVGALITEARRYSDEDGYDSFLSAVQTGGAQELLLQLADALEQQRKQLLDVLTADVSGTAVGLLKTMQQERDAARAKSSKQRRK